MPIIRCYVDQETHDRLSLASDDLGPTLEELAEAAISEMALSDARARYANGERSKRLHIGERA